MTINLDRPCPHTNFDAHVAVNRLTVADDVIVRGAGPMTDDDREHLAELVRALKRRGALDQTEADR